MDKMPPIEKIYEAYTAIADGRVSLVPAESRAAVASSDGAKAYTVTWSGDTYTSNDNGTYWQGYAGYPVIAVLLLQGRLTLDRDAAALFSGVNWTRLNQDYKRNYAAAVDSIVQERGYDAGAIRSAAEKVYSELKALPLSVRRGSVRPPRAKTN